MNPDAIAETLARIEGELAELRTGQAELRTGQAELRTGHKQLLALIIPIAKAIAAFPENERGLMSAVEKSRTTQ